ncbi:MAG: L-serine ammonia-lyase, iron-sulfur-dependent, subunit alpha [Bacteroidales bacterium]|nr:L-serine ammonia-lyase, iron-sulfur-dependent, subunit alpha [Bacteroidales bacterium]
MNTDFLNIDGHFASNEIAYCLSDIRERIDKQLTTKIFRHQHEQEECILHNFDYDRLKNMLSSLVPFKFQPYTLYRIVSNAERNFMLTMFYNDVTTAAHAHLNPPDLNTLLDEMRANPRGFQFDTENTPGGTLLTIKSVNSSKDTVINNVVETFQKHSLFPAYIELWYVRSRDRKLRSIYIVKALLPGKVEAEEQQSLADDFERYLHRYIKPMSVFDIVGPSMVGPSSSHTAGANKIGQIARNIIIARAQADGLRPKSVLVRLYASFRDTGPGHYTPSAIGGGLWGLAPDHPQMLQHGDPAFIGQHGIDFGAFKAQFAGYQRGNPADESKYANENSNNIAEVEVQTDSTTYTITGFSIGGGNVEVRYIDGKRLPSPITGKETLRYHQGRLMPETEGQKLNNSALIQPLTGGIAKQTKARSVMPFNTFEELHLYLHRNKRQLLDVVFEVEHQMQGTPPDEALRRVAEYWRVMKAAVKKGIRSKELTLLKLTGKDAARINRYVRSNPLFDNIYGRAAAYAVAMNEVNAKCGVIVACPTAGSCGILPGVLQAYSEVAHPPRQRLLESMLVAGFMGMILFNDVTTAGADYGCQAEVGVGAAMAAAALAYLEQGSSLDIIHAFTLALKNSLGLICDPVAGLVEVPCVKRNGMYTSVAISAAMMARSGVRSFISPDEVVLTMKEVGDKLHHDYKETAGGGLAKTRDGKAVDRAFASEVKRFFGEN